MEGQGIFGSNQARRSPAKRHHGNRGDTARAAVMVLLGTGMRLRGVIRAVMVRGRCARVLRAATPRGEVLQRQHQRQKQHESH